MQQVTLYIINDPKSQIILRNYEETQNENLKSFVDSVGDFPIN